MSDSQRGILWDLDGVLVDTGEAHYQAWLETLPGYEIPFDHEAFRQIFGMKNDHAIPLLAGKALPDSLVAEISDRKEVAFRRAVRGRAQLFPGVLDWLDRFDRWGLRQAIASSAPPENVAVLVEEAGIEPYFSALISSQGLRGKPDPAIFLEAASRIRIPPYHCLVIEDAVTGVEAAKRAGMSCIAVTTTNPAEVLNMADLVADQLDDLSIGEVRRLIGL